MQTIIGRREALRLGGAAALSTLSLPAWASTLSPQAPRRAILHNLHTGDKLNAVYFENGRYVPDALAEAMRVLRDWRTGEEKMMEPALFDALHAIRTRLETDRPYQIISGYRSPKTNAMLHARSSGVASQSQHTLGKAVDVRIDGVQLAHLHKAALDLAAGGVGYYPQSNFVHVDTGRVRRWQGA
ncbi:DUF882 domain-containing protein [Phenylobacterium sp.]|uniref:DUF882 domain-containing protein n=1 Tax=Phenylobacterium sp. TaxID=1871053 RepID=UPI0035AF7FE5